MFTLEMIFESVNKSSNASVISSHYVVFRTMSETPLLKTLLMPAHKRCPRHCCTPLLYISDVSLPIPVFVNSIILQCLGLNLKFQFHTKEVIKPASTESHQPYEESVSDPELLYDAGSSLGYIYSPEGFRSGIQSPCIKVITVRFQSKKHALEQLLPLTSSSFYIFLLHTQKGFKSRFLLLSKNRILENNSLFETVKENHE